MIKLPAERTKSLPSAHIIFSGILLSKCVRWQIQTFRRQKLIKVELVEEGVRKRDGRNKQVSSTQPHLRDSRQPQTHSAQAVRTLAKVTFGTL